MIITIGLQFLDSRGYTNTIVNILENKIYVKNENSPEWCIHIEDMSYIKRMLEKQDEIKNKLATRQEEELKEELQKQTEEEEYNSIDGFADGFNSMQKGRILKTLNKNILYNNKIVKTKHWIKELLVSGKPEILTFKDYDKDLNIKIKKMYTMNNNTFVELNKTSFDYANYLNKA